MTQKFVALYGGSFNPSTIAHCDIGLQLYRQFHVDEVWYLVSPQNPHKPRKGMASFVDRLAMARLNLEDHPQLVVQDIEAQYAEAFPNGVIETANTLRNLTRDFPRHRFLWAMGADNFASFHTWADHQFISDHFPIVIIPRLGFTEAALQSPSAAAIPLLDDQSKVRVSNGWRMLGVDENNINATDCREELGLKKIPETMKPKVARHAIQNQIYAPG
jgi:nicotinate (nicotinamide) nucleotide adenylyltransferase